MKLGEEALLAYKSSDTMVQNKLAFKLLKSGILVGKSIDQVVECLGKPSNDDYRKTDKCWYDLPKKNTLGVFCEDGIVEYCMISGKEPK